MKITNITEFNDYLKYNAELVCTNLYGKFILSSPLIITCAAFYLNDNKLISRTGRLVITSICQLHRDNNYIMQLDNSNLTIRISTDKNNKMFSQAWFNRITKNILKLFNEKQKSISNIEYLMIHVLDIFTTENEIPEIDKKKLNILQNRYKRNLLNSLTKKRDYISKGIQSQLEMVEKYNKSINCLSHD